MFLFSVGEVVETHKTKELAVNSVECSLCEFAVTYVNNALGNNRSAAHVEELLDKVCNILPSSLKPNCTDFVKKYGLIIAILLQKNETPAQVCDFLKLCNNGTQQSPSRKYNKKLYCSVILRVFFISHVQDRRIVT
jgi:hypothetical protein